MTQSERREFQRLKLARPIIAAVGATPGLILDIGVSGAFVEHYGHAVRGETLFLSFRWRGEAIEFLAEVVHSVVVRDPGGDLKNVVSHTGLHFVEAHGESEALLRDLMTSSVGRILAAQQANAAGELTRSAGESVLARLGEARRRRSHGFVRYRLADGGWTRDATPSAEQHGDGFTVPAWEDDDEVGTLCSTYEKADEEGRRLIRVIAGLSAERA